MNKIISGIIALMLAFALTPALASTASAAPVTQTVVAKAAKKDCSDTKMLTYSVDFNNNTAYNRIFYKICTKGRGNKWVRNLSMTTGYNHGSDGLACALIPYEGVKATLYFQDQNGKNFSKKVNLPCKASGSDSRHQSLKNTPRLAYTGGKNGVPRSHGVFTEKWSLGIPDVEKTAGKRYPLKK